MLEGWATAAAFEFARDLATEGVIDLDLLVPTGRLPESRRVWAELLLTELERSGLLERSGRVLRLNDLDLPSAQAVFSTIASQHPERAAELLLAAGAGEALRALAAGAADVKGPSDSAIEGYDLRSASATAAARALEQRLEAVAPVEVDRVSLRILQVGAGAASSVALRFAEARGARVTLLEPDARRLRTGPLRPGRRDRGFVLRRSRHAARRRLRSRRQRRRPHPAWLWAGGAGASGAQMRSGRRVGLSRTDAVAVSPRNAGVCRGGGDRSPEQPARPGRLDDRMRARRVSRRGGAARRHRRRAGDAPRRGGARSRLRLAAVPAGDDPSLGRRWFRICGNGAARRGSAAAPLASSPKAASI